MPDEVPQEFLEEAANLIDPEEHPEMVAPLNLIQWVMLRDKIAAALYAQSKKSKWIPLAEKMPEQGRLCLWFFIEKREPWCGRFDGEVVQRTPHLKAIKLSSFSHWAEMPTLPE